LTPNLRAVSGAASSSFGHCGRLEQALDPEEYLGVDRLRAGVAAPEPPGDGGEEEEGDRRRHQQQREVDEVLRPEDQPENVELARRQIEEDRLPVVSRRATAGRRR